LKFVLFVEGYTEKHGVPAFLKRFLDQRLKHPVGIKVVRFDGWAELVKDSPIKAAMYLNDPRQMKDILGVIALIDLHGPTFYPTDRKSADARLVWAKKYLEDRVQRDRFHQFFAVHEVEAWLLSDPDLLPPQVKRALPPKAKNPEKVDFDEPPKKLLQRLYREKTGRSYKNVMHGQELFSALSPDLAYGKCPQLKVLLDKMLELAREAGL